MERYFQVNKNGYSVKCKAYFNNPREIDSAIVSCHGFGGSKDNTSTAKMAEILLPKHKRLQLVTFDWPCHGGDARHRLKLEECSAYLAAVVEHIREQGIENICCQATSFGGYLVLKYLSEHENPFKKVALRCPAVNMYTALTEVILTAEQLELLERGRAAETGFDRQISIYPDFARELQENDIAKRSFFHVADDVLIMHGSADELISHDFVRAFADDNVIEFISIEGADHRYKNPAKMRRCVDLMEEFFKGYI